MTTTRDEGLRRGIVQRLEEVLEDGGFRSLRDFHQYLAGDGGTFSYTAVRNYHDPDPERGRFPPLPYLLAVASAFGIHLEWLLLGSGKMYGPDPGEEENEYQRRIREVERVHPDFKRWPPWAQHRLVDLTAYAGAINPPMLLELVELVEKPFHIEGNRFLEELDHRERNAYFHSMLSALYVVRRSYHEGHFDALDTKSPTTSTEEEEDHGKP